MNKATLRKQYLEKRLILSDTEYERRNNQLVKNLFEQVDLTNAEYIHIFLPIVKFKEVNTWLIIDRIQEQFPTSKIALPKVKGDVLIHYLFDNNNQLTTSKWGIEEPASGVVIDPALLDLVFVPLVIADKAGNRIGYGKGFYDRFLIECKPSCQKIGLSLLPVLDYLDCIEVTDIALDDIIEP